MTWRQLIRILWIGIIAYNVVNLYQNDSNWMWLWAGIGALELNAWFDDRIWG